MMRIRRTIVSSCVALFCGAAWGHPFQPALYLPIAASVVRVEAVLEGGRLSVGSGVTVAPAIVATNCHVVRDSGSIRVAGGGVMWEVDGEVGDARHDVCFLRVPGWSGHPVALAQSDAPEVGATVVALGFTAGAPIRPRMGNVRALREIDGAQVIEADAQFNSGSSGGGLFDEDGTLVGLLTFRRRNSTTSFYALPVEWVRQGIPREDQWESVKPLEGAAPFWDGEGAALLQ
ncbi:MAG TPA: serine protease [Usitatibacter sp.]|nr:serine protease [Usitatibacter sp.]